ncbi:MAG: GNAT family N-acetyltransferase [Candidatus Thermoplasmatota archaeon]
MRRLTEEDLDFALELTDREGWGYSRPELERVLRMSSMGSYLWDEGGPSGFVASLHYGRTAVIGHLVVSEVSRGRKVGRKLLEASLADFDRAGFGSVVVFSTPAAERLYHSCGFERTRQLVSYGFIVEGRGTSSPCERLLPEDLREVCGIDARVFGDDRSQFIEGLFREYPDLCYKVRRGGRITGYCLGRRNPLGGDLGPLASLSPSPEDALALVDTFLGGFAGRRVDLGFFDDVPYLRSFMGSCASVKRIPVRMMVRGEDRYSAAESGALGIAGFELG